MPQRGVEYATPEALEGMPAYGGMGHYNIIRGTRDQVFNAGQNVIPFGRAVVRDPNNIRAIYLPGDPKMPATATQFCGISVIDEGWGTAERDIIAGRNIGFKPHEPVDLFAFGDIWVYCYTPITGDQVANPMAPAVYYISANSTVPPVPPATTPTTLEAGRFASTPVGTNQQLIATVPGNLFWTRPLAKPGLTVINIGGF